MAAANHRPVIAAQPRPTQHHPSIAVTRIRYHDSLFSGGENQTRGCHSLCNTNIITTILQCDLMPASGNPPILLSQRSLRWAQQWKYASGGTPGRQTGLASWPKWSQLVKPAILAFELHN